MNTSIQSITRKIRIWILFFISALVLSGVTAFPIETELYYLKQWSGLMPGPIGEFVNQVSAAVKESNAKFPFLAYGTDWLAFAHIVIAIAFIGPLRDPVKNIWVIEFGIISCLLIFPLAFICGSIRHIPVYWQLIDCSFGVFGLVPLLYTHGLIKKLDRLSYSTNY